MAAALASREREGPKTPVQGWIGPLSITRDCLCLDRPDILAAFLGGSSDRTPAGLPSLSPLGLPHAESLHQPERKLREIGHEQEHDQVQTQERHRGAVQIQHRTAEAQ